jgi:hypothetical protein
MLRQGVSAPPWWVGALLAAGLFVSACGLPPDPATGGADGEAPLGATSDEVACSTAAVTRFPATLLEGPESSRDEFRDTPAGAALEAFFVGGPGAPEGGQYLDADGFSIVSDSLVLGYRGRLPESFFALENGQVAGWGGCSPTRLTDGLVAARWQPVGPVDSEATVLSIAVEGGACATDGEPDVLTEVIAVDVDERADQVVVTAWTRDKPLQGPCPGVGVTLDREVELTAPLGDRQLLDGGRTPPAEVEWPTSGDEPPATGTEDRESTLGRLDCGDGRLVERRVPDRAQDRLEIARAAAPAVVEMEPGQPRWWWGLNDAGAVVVALALGDAVGADYQLWACDPPLDLGVKSPG